MEEDKKWYALYTKPRWEKKVDRSLLLKGVESWCPLQKIEKQWSDRKKIIDEPLFKSYVFVHIDDKKEKVAVLSTNGVLNFVHYLKKPAIIRDEEIDLIKRYLTMKDTTITLIAGMSIPEETKIKVNSGIFIGNEGTVVRGGRKKVYVKLESLGQIMVVEFPVEFLTPVQ